MMKILAFTSALLFLIIPQIAYGSEILAEPEKSLFGPNDWIWISLEVDGYSGGDIMWTATKPDGTTSDGVFSNIQASKTNHSIARDASDGQFGTWKVQYEYKDAVKIIDVEVEPLTVSVTTDKPSYLPGNTAIVRFSTNHFNPNAAQAENMTTNIFDVDGVQLQSVDDIEMKVYQPVIVQHFSIDELLRDKSFGVFHLVVTYYGIQVNVPFEILNPNSSTSIFLSSDKQVYSPTDPVELNFVINSVSADSGILSITLPSGKIITKTISVDSSLTRALLDDVDTSQTGSYLLQFDYAGNSTVGSFEVYSETRTNSNLPDLELNLTLDKLSYRPGEMIQATINTSKLIEQDVTYWIEDSSGSQGIELPFVPSTLGTFTIPHVLPETFLHGPSKLHVKYGPVETSTLFFVAGDVMTDSEQIVTTQYDGPEVLLALDDSAFSSQIIDISISPNSELFVLYSDPRVSVFDMQGKLLRTWDLIGDGQLNKPASIFTEDFFAHISDAGNSRIVTFDHDGYFISDWGNSGIDYQSVISPTDIAVDGLGFYHISDARQDKILKFNANGTYSGQINSLLTASAKFTSIESITSNMDDIFLLSATNNRILHFIDTGEFLTSFGTEGQNNKQFHNPTSLQFFNDNLYVADSGNSRVLVLTASGDYVTQWGTFGTGPGQFNQMIGIDVDSDGSIWVADSDNRIQKFASISNTSKLEIPEWIKNNAKWWSENQIDDDSFIQGIEFLIKEKVLSVSVSSSSTGSSQDIPEWIKNNAGWWSNGTISEDDFVNGLEYLIENGIINTS